MLDVRVGLEAVDELVVVAAGVVAERLVALEDDHRGAVGLELLEHLADALHRDDRRGLARAHRHRALLPDDLELGHGGVQDTDQDDPADDDRD
ncbi:hypothetical protein MPHL43070_15285 [Mycolicibacterium phlei DSM 43070]|nr:hypothetical protein MPHL43070_15285 [Mycolicibacterium phlei DSM 43070]